MGSHMRGAVSEGKVIPGMLVDSLPELEAEGGVMGPSGELEAKPESALMACRSHQHCKFGWASP